MTGVGRLILASVPVISAAMLAATAGLRDSIGIAIPLKQVPAISSIAPANALAGAFVYQNKTETTIRYAPAASPNGPELLVTFDDIPIPLSTIGGATTLNVTKVTFGIRRAGTATTPPGTACDITAYWATATTEVTDPDTQLDQPTHLIGTVSLPPPTHPPFTTELVSFGDGTNTLFTVDLNDTWIDGPGAPYGAFLLGISITPGTDIPNGWRVTAGPDANVDALWQLDPNNGEEAALFFGGPPANPLTSFYIIVEGNPVTAPACPADLTGNDVVDVDDLLALINNWGDCVACPEDITGNGVVDVDDLLELINAWGPCD